MSKKNCTRGLWIIPTYVCVLLYYMAHANGWQQHTTCWVKVVIWQLVLTRLPKFIYLIHDDTLLMGTLIVLRF